jgi:ABC-type multidrug transport system ATPase subunit
MDPLLSNGSLTALLPGHNGAGKSTTISILTGLTPPTAGDATVNGHSVANHMARVRRSLGICPQHDVLWPQLTVRTTLRLYGVLKGVPIAQLLLEVDKILESVGLASKAGFPTAALSGGQKRRLSVAVAFVGGSSTVILDEPTSGVDVFSRRDLWRLIQDMRASGGSLGDGRRTILLTTHFLEEADILSDRVAIMSRGRMRAVGTASELKQDFGIGYTLVLARVGEGKCDAQRELLPLLRRHCGDGVEVVSDHGQEIACQLPSATVPAFPALFEELDRVMGSIGVSEYGISMTSLQDVFLRLAVEGEEVQAKSVSAGTDAGEPAPESNIALSASDSSELEASARSESNAELGQSMEERHAQRRARSQSAGLAVTAAVAALAPATQAEDATAVAEATAAGSLEVPLLQDDHLAPSSVLSEEVMEARQRQQQGSRSSSPRQVWALLQMQLSATARAPRVLLVQVGTTVAVLMAAGLLVNAIGYHRPGCELPGATVYPALPLTGRSLPTLVGAGPSSAGGAGFAPKFVVDSAGARLGQLAPEVQFRQRASCQAVRADIRANATELQGGLCGVGSGTTVVASDERLLTLWQQPMTHLLPALVNLRHSALLSAPALISVSTQPFDAPPKYLGDQGSNINSLIYCTLVIAFAMPLVPAVLALQHAKERESGVVLQVKLSGVSPTTYWLACLAHDMIWVVAAVAISLVAWAVVGGSAVDLMFHGTGGGFGIATVVLFLCSFIDTSLVANVITARAKDPSRSFGTIWGSQFGVVFVFIAAAANIIISAGTDGTDSRFVVLVVTGERCVNAPFARSDTALCFQNRIIRMFRSRLCVHSWGLDSREFSISRLRRRCSLAGFQYARNWLVHCISRCARGSHVSRHGLLRGAERCSQRY